MKFLFEIFPVFIFFIAFKFKGIFFATAIAIIASILQIAFSYLKNKKVETPMIISLVVIIIFGGATLILHNEIFIKWKPTILYGIFSLIIFAGRIFFSKNIMKVLLDSKISMPDDAWDRINYSWAGFFAFVAAANIFVAYHFSTEVWVNFKLFGIMGLMFVFAIVQALFMSKYVEVGDSE
ncbi:MAG TPA: septation protein A [Spirochaetota bacterium]|nr:septation protein A [Spirochaetota bacterium]